MNDPFRIIAEIRRRSAGNPTVRLTGLMVTAIGITLAALKAAVWMPMLLVGLLMLALSPPSGFFRAAGLLIASVALLACMTRAVYATPVLAVGLSLIWLSRPSELHD